MNSITDTNRLAKPWQAAEKLIRSTKSHEATLKMIVLIRVIPFVSGHFVSFRGSSFSPSIDALHFSAA